MNNILTASRQNALLTCLRKHYWQYEVGLQSDTSSFALSFGAAWARAGEARWNGATFEQAFDAATNVETLDELGVATLCGMLTGYYHYYGNLDADSKMVPEFEFRYMLEGSRTFEVGGKMDALGYHCAILKIIESKTTGDSVDAASDYWMRLRFNIQVYQYITAARHEGYDVSEVIYDVTRKPSIRPKEICDLATDGNKIVNDVHGVRQFKRNGEPRESGDTARGFVVQSHLETPDEYCARLTEDCKSRPEFYFARREVPILEDELLTFERQRITLSRIILECRQMEKREKKAEDAWPRNVSENTCGFCQYAGFCLTNCSPPSTGFTVNHNPELKK